MSSALGAPLSGCQGAEEGQTHFCGVGGAVGLGTASGGDLEEALSQVWPCRPWRPCLGKVPALLSFRIPHALGAYGRLGCQVLSGLVL